jgi:hypothetical protein
MDFSRRAFLYLVSASAGMTLAACSRTNEGPKPSNSVNSPQTPPSNNEKPGPAPAAANKRGLLIGPGGKKNKQGEMEFFLATVNMDLLADYIAKKIQPSLVPITFRGHAVVPHPVEPTRVALFEKWGPGACEIDLKQGRVLRTITTVTERQFYGHGAWSTDGTLLYAVEAGDRAKGNYDGVIAIRDAKTMEMKGTFPTHGKLPHDCHLLDDGKTLGITNGGGGRGSPDVGCVTFVDIASEKLLEKVPVPDYLAGHMAITARSSKGGLAVVSTPFERPDLGEEGFKKVPGAISLRAAGAKEITTMTTPAEVISRMLGETLSVAIHEGRGIVGATNPAGNIATFWDLKQGKYLRSFDLAVARGIAVTLDQKNFVVTYGNETSCVLIDVENLEIVEGTRFSPTGIAGSHMITYEYPGM